MSEEKNKQDFKAILDKHFAPIPKAGDVVSGTVISISKREIHLDIPGITSGVIRGREAVDDSGEYSNVQVGDLIEATVLELENEKGEMELSLRVAGRQRAWDKLVKFHQEKEVIDIKITDANKGGLMASCGRIKGFLPVSQLSPEHYPRVPGGDKTKILEKLRKFVGETFSVLIYDLDQKEEKLIFSEKEARSKEQTQEMTNYKEGDIVEGQISAITDFGAFIKFNKSEGLIHISEIAWERVENPSDFFKTGDNVKAQIISISGPKIFLSIKRLLEDPWQNIDKKYKLGNTVEGKVVKITSYGVFVELDGGVHGLVHLSELDNKKEALNVGDKAKFKIIIIEPKERRLGLSCKKALTKIKAPVEKKSEDKKEKELKSGNAKKNNEEKESKKDEKEKVKK